jgi:hypothetical protein
MLPDRSMASIILIPWVLIWDFSEPLWGLAMAIINSIRAIYFKMGRNFDKYRKKDFGISLLKDKLDTFI